MKNHLWLQLFLLCSIEIAFAEVTPKYNNPASPNHWECDTIFIGADIVVADSNSNIQVTWKKAMSGTTGELSFMDPFHPDSAIFLFHNLLVGFSGEPKTRSIGKFPVGTKLVFRYVVTDTSAIHFLIGKKLYSGQNIEGIDTYISDNSSAVFGHRWAAVRKIDETRVWVGFSECLLTSYDNIILRCKVQRW
jgi:hypothetical protein